MHVTVRRAPGVLVLVDAAHALGQLPLSIAALGADFVAANCHKWLGGARGSAVLWAARSQQAHLRPLVVSHGHGHGFTSSFIWDGAPRHHEHRGTRGCGAPCCHACCACAENFSLK